MLLIFDRPFFHMALGMTLLVSSLPTVANADGGFLELSAGNQNTWSLAQDISADGSSIVGEVGLTGSFKQAAIWRKHQGTYQQEDLTTDISSAYDISADGRRAVGYIKNQESKGWGEAFLWSQEKGLQKIGRNDSSASAISANGQVLAGSMSENGSVFSILFKGDLSRLSIDRGFFRKEDGKIKGIGNLNGGKNSHVNDISADGSVIVGSANDGKADNELRAVRFTEAKGLQNLGTLNGGNHSYAESVSADGNVIVGGATDGSTGNRHLRAFRWTETTGMQDIGMLTGGKYAFAKGISADGQVIIGKVSFNDAHAEEAFRWTQDGGMQLVEKWLTDNGVNIPSGLKIKSINAINTNGSVVVGQLTNNHAFVAWTQTK